MAPTTANKVADYILCYSHSEGDYISNLKIQKLVYYAQAWFLALHDEPLFEDHIQAWVHGPVQPKLFRRFEKYGWKPILEEPKCPKFKDERIKPHLDEIMNVFGDCTAHHLSRLTHQEDPWRLTRRGLGPDQPSESIISHEAMRDYYKRLAAQ
jgi:uncharacterized phage-associated protein